jgi:hypothetical protein
MPQDQFRQINGPQGPINFPGSMSDEQVESAMRKLYPPKQYLPEVNQALANAPGRPTAPPESMWSQFEQMPSPMFGSFPGGRPFFNAKNQAVVPQATGDYSGKRGYRQVVEGVEQASEPNRRDLMQGSARAVGGVFEAATPLMIAGAVESPVGTAKAIAGGEIGGYFGRKGVQLAGGGPEAQEFAGMLGNVIGGSIGVGHETLKSGTLAGAVADKTLPEKFGEHAKATPLEAPSTPKTQDQIAALKAETEAETHPIAPVERVERITKKPTPMDLSVKEPSVQDRVAKIKEQAAPKPTPEQEIADLRAQRAQEETDLRSQISERRTLINVRQALNPKALEKYDALGNSGVPRYDAPGNVEGYDALGIKKAAGPQVPEADTRLAQKQAEMKVRQDAINAKQAENERFIQEHRAAEDARVARLRKEVDARKAFISKASGSSQMGTEATPTETAQPAAKPIPAPKETTRSGEPIRAASQPEVRESAKGAELGRRIAKQPDNLAPVDFNQRMQVARERVAKWQEEHPGVSKSEAQRIVSEQMKKERGSLGGSEPDSPQARREAKIKIYMDILRDPKASPKSLDVAYKTLTELYGLSHDHIISRMAGGAEFAKTPIEERLGPNKHLDAKADSLIGGMMDQVDRVMDRHQPVGEQKPLGKEGDASIGGVKDPGQVELERMFNLRDERGFWKMWPSRKAKPAGPGTGTALDDLTRNIETSLKAVPPDGSRMRVAERLNRDLTEGWDTVQMSLGRIAAHAAALKDSYLRPPNQTDYPTAMGRFSGALNHSAEELHQFTKKIKKMLPDERQREAVTNYIQAGGDDAVLAKRAAASKGSVRAAYERARTLTPTEVGYAKMIEAHFDRRLKEAIQLGILDHGIENYVPQIWKRSDQGAMNTFFSSITRSGLLKPDFNAAKHRIWDSYFEGEQLGRKPISKDIGFLVASWEKAFNTSVASRNLMHELTNGFASDGRPILSPSGSGKTIWDRTESTTDPEASAYLVYPKATPDETGDYRAVNHPALTKWTWVGKDAQGAPIFMKGDLLVHPEFAQKLDNVINRGKWAAEHPVQTGILKGQGFFKATLLSASPFHQIQEGTHAIFHLVNPLSPPQIDLANPTMNKLLDRGLVIGNYDPIAGFSEGLTSGSGGAIGKIPGLGRQMQKYSDFLFHDYIPRLKAKMAMEAYERNMKRFQGALVKGEITSDQIAEITASQANAAFGELNYILLGRHPQTQAVMRMMVLAPDFFEARVRFAGQALSPFGREQRAALVRGALGMYGIARILNYVLDDDPHWDKPFSVVVHGYEYKIRSLPGDIWNLMSDENSFLQHRLSFLPRAFTEFATGKDDFGRKRDAGEQAMDFVRNVVPIPLQGFMKSGMKDPLGSAMSSFGVTRGKYRTAAGALAHEYAIGNNPNDVTSHHISQLVQDYTDNKVDNKQVGDWIKSGQMNPRDVLTAMKLAQLPEIYRDYRNLPVELKAKVWKKASPQERMILNTYARKEFDMTRLLPEQRAEFMKSFAKQ